MSPVCSHPRSLTTHYRMADVVVPRAPPLRGGSLACLSHARRTIRDYERLPDSEALIIWAAVTLMTRRLNRAR
jgi:hypothetical protein